MAGRMIERTIVGTTEIGGEVPVATPTPSPVTQPILYSEILKRHEKIRGIIRTQARKGECITPEAIAEESKLDLETAKMHIEILEGDKYITWTDKGEGARICDREVLNKLYESLGKIVFHE